MRNKTASHWTLFRIRPLESNDHWIKPLGTGCHRWSVIRTNGWGYPLSKINEIGFCFPEQQHQTSASMTFIFPTAKNNWKLWGRGISFRCTMPTSCNCFGLLRSHSEEVFAKECSTNVRCEECTLLYSWLGRGDSVPNTNDGLGSVCGNRMDTARYCLTNQWCCWW